MPGDQDAPMVEKERTDDAATSSAPAPASSSSSSSSSSSDAPRPANIHLAVASELRKTEDEKKQLAEENARKLREMEELANKLRKAEEALKSSQSRLEEYDSRKRRQLQDKFEKEVKPFVSSITENAKPEDQEDIKRFHEELQASLNQPMEKASRLEPAFKFVETCASAARCQSSKFEEVYQREKALIEQRDAKIRELEQYKKTLEAKDNEMNKLKEQIKKAEEEKEKATKSIKNVESHFNSEPNPAEPQLGANAPPRAVETIASGAPQNSVPGSGGFEDLMDLGAPTTDWRSMDTSIKPDTYSSNIRQAWSQSEMNKARSGVFKQIR